MDNKLSKMPLRCFHLFLVIAIFSDWIFSSINYNSVTIKIDDDEPRIAWLMSFPNSGTSYTKHLVDVVSGYNTASNYGKENRNEGEDGAITPTGFVLTKTHCGSYCLWCKSEEYISTAAQFSRNCGRTTSVPQGDNKPQIGYYNTSLVKRAVHLIRDPFSNIVARFHLYNNNEHFTSGGCLNGILSDDKDVCCAKSCGRCGGGGCSTLPGGDSKCCAGTIRDSGIMCEDESDTACIPRKVQKKSYTLDEIGFRTMCSELDANMKEDTASSPFYRDVKDLVKVIPCSSDFYRWTQWHNLAHITTYDLGMPTLIIHYENYTHNFNQTVDSLHNFLRLEKKNEAPLFVTGKTYKEYYTQEERKAVKEMVEKLATKKTWENVHHYFE